MIDETQPGQGYIPGTCNIGKKEIAKRRNIAIGAGVATIIMAAYILAARPGHLLTISIFIPAYITTISFMQAQSKFCAAFGMMAVFRFDENSQGNAGMEEYVNADKAKALKIIFNSGLIAALGTAAFIWLSSLLQG